MHVEHLPGELRFPTPVRLRVGDRFIFLPTVEQAVEWLLAPANEALRGRLTEAFELLLAARDSRSPVDMRVGFRAFMDGVAKECLVFR